MSEPQTTTAAAPPSSRATLIYRLCRPGANAHPDLCLEAAVEIRSLLAVVELFVSLAPGMDADFSIAADTPEMRMTIASGIGALLLGDYA